MNLNPQQFGHYGPPKAKGVSYSKVTSKGYQLPKVPPTPEERTLMLAKAKKLEAETASINRQTFPTV
jgi:hypothetical protein